MFFLSATVTEAVTMCPPRIAPLMLKISALYFEWPSLVYRLIWP
jgi:hypothetical protein